MMVSFIKEDTYFASYPYEVFLYLKYQQSTKSCACDKSHWQNILRVCQRMRERSHASPDMAWIYIGQHTASIPWTPYNSLHCSVISGQTHGFQDVHNAIFVST